MNRLLRRTLYAGSAACCGAILWGASQASAAGDETPVDQVQQVLIGNSTDQGADASILNKQININLPVAVLGAGGQRRRRDAVQHGVQQRVGEQHQRHHADRRSGAGRLVDGRRRGRPAAVGDVSNQTSQSAEAPVENRQVNVNLPVAVLSPKANVGDVTQSNEASNDASATNRNVTDQAVAQEQAADAASSKGHGPAGQAAVSQDQAADVANATSQEAQAPVVSEQSNEATRRPVARQGRRLRVRPHRRRPPAATSSSRTRRRTSPRPATPTRPTRRSDRCRWPTRPGRGAQDQSADVANARPVGGGSVSNDQANHADGRGDVTQSNAATNEAAANNATAPIRSSSRARSAGTAAGKHGDAAVVQDQSADVSNATDQSAGAPVDNDQANVVGDDHGKDKDKDKGKDKGKGKGPHGPAPIPGDVTQSNEAANTAAASNVNRTSQGVVQGQAAEATGSKGHAAVVQTQSANPTNATRQAAEAPVSNDQRNVVKRQASGPGSVTQSNEATNDATAANTNVTEQSVAQGQVASVVADGPKDHGPKSHGPKSRPEGSRPEGSRSEGSRSQARRVHAGALRADALPSLSAHLG